MLRRFTQTQWPSAIAVSKKGDDTSVRQTGRPWVVVVCVPVCVGGAGSRHKHLSHDPKPTAVADGEKNVVIGVSAYAEFELATAVGPHSGVYGDAAAAYGAFADAEGPNSTAVGKTNNGKEWVCPIKQVKFMCNS